MDAQTALAGLRLGVARVAFSPPVGGDLSGFIARIEPMSGVHDELSARALVWADGDGEGAARAALVALDVVELDAPQVATIRRRVTALTGLPGEQVGVICTHTHGGPATMPNRWLGRVDLAFLDQLCQTAAEAVRAAAAASRPVVLRWACGQEATVARNRRVPDGIIDPAVPVLRFQRLDGTVAALLVSYACHPVTLGPNNPLATADYPGYVRRTLEAAYPDALALFVTGCCGQINNGHTARDGERGRGLEWRTFAEAERIGRAIAGAAIQAAEQAARLDTALATNRLPIRPARVATARRTIPLPMLPGPTAAERERLVAAWRAEASALAARERRPGELERLEVFLAWAEAHAAGRLQETAEAEIMAIALDDVTLVLLPGEEFVETGLAIKERTAPRPVITIGYANGTPGYIPHRSAYPAGGYEIDEAYRYYGYPACFAPEAAEAVVETAVALVEEIAAEEVA